MKDKVLGMGLITLGVLALSVIIGTTVYLMVVQMNAPEGVIEYTIGENDIVIYDDELLGGWEDWSYSSVRDFNQDRIRYSGERALSVSYQGNWGGVQLARPAEQFGEDFAAIRFAVHGGSLGGQSLNVVIVGDASEWSESVVVKPRARQWDLYEIPLSDFGNPTFVRGVVFQEGKGSFPGTLYIDSVILIGKDDVNLEREGPAISVNVSEPTHNISPLIYGVNFADEAFMKEIALPLNRWGGNAVTRYNWQLDVSNRASDWYFMNIPNDQRNPDNLPTSAGSNRFVALNKLNDTESIMTMPMIGWTPKNRTAEDCAYALEVYGEQQWSDPDERCGNGVLADETPIDWNDPTDTSTAIDETFVTDWIAHLVEQHGTAEEGGVEFYSLDNEPMLWHYTHRDVHPEPVGYDELRDLSYRYGAAIKSADPTAKTLGPVLWGWSVFQYSAIDLEAGNWGNPPDRSAHDGTPLVTWYLQEMARYEQENGTRILDYLDLHFYPQTENVPLNVAGGAGVQTRRLRSTRALWDPSYVDESWIDESIYLIPRMRAWVDEHYPGTGIALTEYNWGGLENINGALAQADILGIFGRENLDLATLWDPPTSDQPGAFAFRMFRNYDGNGSQFGDQSLVTTTDDVDSIAVHAARRSSDGAITILVLNKTRYAQTTELTLDGLAGDAPASGILQSWRYSDADLGAIGRSADEAYQDGVLSTTLPGYSMTLYILQP